MAMKTLEMGPTWKMQLLCGLLEERGVPAFVQDVNLKTIDPFITGPMSFDARLQVPEEAVDAARSALEEARREGAEELEALDAEALEGAPPPEPEEPAAEADPELEVMADIGRRIRWSALLFWTHPFLFVYGWRYLSWSLRTGRGAPHHGATLLTLFFICAFWGTLLAAILAGIRR